MWNKKLLSLFILILVFFLAGCWDSIELNEHAFVLGSGIDLVDDHEYELSSQVVLPSKIGGGDSGTSGNREESVFVSSGKGPSIGEAVKDLQMKLSRYYNKRQRQIIYLGQEIAENGLQEIVDYLTRTSDAELSGAIFVVKDDMGKNALSAVDPLEYSSAIAALRKYQHTDEAAKGNMLNFFIEHASDSIYPTLPALSLDKQQKSLLFVGSAILDKQLRLVDYLDVEETKYKMWITEHLSKLEANIPITDGNGSASVHLIHLKSTIRPDISKENIRFLITLSGEGEVLENNTKYDLTNSANVKKVKQQMEEYFKQNINDLIKKTQKDYRADIFGFGEILARKHPSKWKKVKNDWEEEFGNAEITVEIDMTIHLIGLTGKLDRQIIENKKEEE